MPARIATDCAGTLETGVSGGYTPLRPASARVGRLMVTYSDRGWLNVQSNTSMGDGGILSVGPCHYIFHGNRSRCAVTLPFR